MKQRTRAKTQSSHVLGSCLAVMFLKLLTQELKRTEDSLDPSLRVHKLDLM